MNPQAFSLDPSKEEVYRLATGVLSGDISDTEAQRLERLVLDNPTSRRLYIEFIFDASSLRLLVGRNRTTGEVSRACGGEVRDKTWLRAEAEPLEPFSEPSVQPIIVVDRSTPIVRNSLFDVSLGSIAFSYVAAALILGLLLLGVWPCKVTHYTNQHLAVVNPNRVPEEKYIGQITGMAECKWSDPQTIAYLGSSVPLNRRYALASGLMEITYQSGAKVILEGPCEYKVESSAGGFLGLGKLTARVQKEGETRRQGGKERMAEQISKSPNPQISKSPNPSPLSPRPSPLFSVRTPTAIVTDLGTEFGVEVDQSGASRTHVFQGKVELHSAAEGKEGSFIGRLEAGESVRIDARGAIVRDAPPAKGFFVRAQDFSELQLNALRRRRAASLERFRHDPALAAYYAFDNERTAPDRLLNRALATAGRLDGVLGEPGNPETRPTWVEGRTPGSRALRFEAEKKQAVVVPNNDALNVGRSLTVAAWVKPNRLSTPHAHVVLSRRDYDTVGFQFAIIGENSLHPYSIQLFTDMNDLSYSGPVLPAREEWLHVAAAQGPGFKQFFLNGRLSDQAGSSAAVAKLSADLWIGVEPPRNDQHNWFDGLMGEIWLFRRALTPAEIRDLYDLGSFRESAVETSAAGQSLDAAAGATPSSSKEK